MPPSTKTERKARRSRIESLIRSVTPKAWRVAVSLMGNPNDAEDLLQDAYLRAALKVEQIPRSNPWPWFARVLTLEAMNARRKRAKYRLPTLTPENTMASPNAGPEDLAITDELAQLLRDSLSSLPEKERDALSLRYVGGLTNAEAAEALGIPLGTLKKRVRDGLDSLRTRIGRKDHNLESLLTILPFGAPAAGFQIATDSWIALALKAAAIGTAGGTIMKKSAAIIILAILLLVGGGTMVLFDTTSEDSKQSSTQHTDSRSTTSYPNSNRGEEVDNKKLMPTDDATKEASNPVEARSEDIASKPEVLPEEVARGIAFQATISGQVVDTRGMPIASAGINAIPAQGGAEEKRAFNLKGNTKSDNQGRFSIQVSGRRSESFKSCFLALSASAEGFVPSNTFRYTLRDKEELGGVRIPLYAGAGSLKGRVISDLDGTPIAGVRVGAFAYLSAPDVLGAREDGVRVDVSPDFEAEQQITAEDGSFTFANLPDASFRVRAWIGAPDAKAQAPWAMGTRLRSAQAQNVRVRAGFETPFVELSLPYNQTLSFTLKPKIDGPVQVALQSTTRVSGYSGEGFGIALESDEDGVFHADWLRVDHKFVLIKAVNYEQKIINIAPLAGKDLDLGEITLSEGYELNGRVVADGRGLEGARVWIQRQSQGGGGIARPDGYQEPIHLIESTTNERGEFSLKGLPANGKFEVVARHADYADGKKSLSMTTGQAPKGFEIELEAGGTLYGQVADPNMLGGGESSRMLQRDAIILTQAGRTRVSRTTALDAKMLGFLAGSALMRFDLSADGSYRAERIPAGSYMALAIRDRRITYHMRVEIKAGQEQQLDFTFPPPGGIVEGRITRYGKPIAKRGVQLYFAPKPNGRVPFGGAYTTTDKNGNYRFTGVREGRFVVALSGESVEWTEGKIAERLYESVDGKVGVIDIDLIEFRATVKGSGRLGGRNAFSRAALTPLAGGISSRDFYKTMDSDGNFTISELPAGEYQLWFSGGEGFQSQFHAVQTLSISEAQSEYEIHADFPSATLSGSISISGLDGALPEIEVEAKRHFEPALGKISGYRSKTIIKADRDGTFTFPHLWAGKFTLTVKAAGFVPIVRELNLKGASSENFALSSPAGWLILKLDEIDGVHPKTLERGANADIKLFGPDDELVKQSKLYYGKGASNQLRFDSLKPGLYRAEISGRSVESSAIESIRVVEGEETTFGLVLYGAAWVKFELAEGDDQPSKIDFAKATRKLFDSEGAEITPIPYPSPMSARLANGSFFLMPIAAGEYRIEIKVEGYLLLSQHFTVARGDKRTIPLSFTKE